MDKEPLSILNCLKISFSIYIRRMIWVIGIFFTQLAIFMCTSLVYALGGETGGGVVIGAVLFILSVFLALFGHLMITFIFYFEYSGQTFDLSSLIVAVWSKISVYFITGLVVSLMVIACFILFVIPGIWATVVFSFAPSTVVFKGHKIWDALTYSKQLAAPHFWKLLWVYLCFMLISLVTLLFYSLAPLVILIFILLLWPLMSGFLIILFRNLEIRL